MITTSRTVITRSTMEGRSPTLGSKIVPARESSHHCRLEHDRASVATNAQDQQCAARDRGQLQLEGSPVSTAPHLLKLAATSPAINL